MLSARRQQECLKQLMGGGLAIGDTLLIFDWKEKIRLPIGPQETSAMWHCQQKYAISCFGCCVLSHKPTSTVAKPDIQTTYLLLLNEVREQNAEASNRMLQEVIRECSVSTEGVLHLWSDCGPHFRSAENLHHHMYDLCVKRKQVINCSFLAEQHGKNVLDSAFGALSRWLGEQALRRPVLSVQNLHEAISAGADAAMKRDPQGPLWKCRVVDFGQYRQQTSRYVRTEDFKITRTYCLIARPPATNRANPILENRTFSDMPADGSPSCSYRIEEVEHPDEVPWKLSFYEGAKTWEEPPPDIGDETVLTRKREAQKHRPCPTDMKPLRSFQDRVNAKARKAVRDQARLRRQLAALSGPADTVSDDSSSDSSSSSDSEDASP